MLIIGSKVKVKNTELTSEIIDVIIPTVTNCLTEPMYVLNDICGWYSEKMLDVIKPYGMNLEEIQEVYSGKYTRMYNLHYKNLANKEKIYESVSRKDLKQTEIGKHNDAITMIIHHKSENKYLLLQEFRLAANQFIFNVVAGLVENGENPIDACIREVFEETNIVITEDNITYSLPASFSAIGLSDEQQTTYFIEVDGQYQLHTDGNPNEPIIPKFYSLNEIEYLLKHEKFTSRTQMLFEMLVMTRKGKNFWNV